MSEFAGKPHRLVGVLVAIVVFFSPVAAQSSSTPANELFVSAVTLHRQSADLPPEERDSKLREVRDLFDRILAEHPDSDVAEMIKTNPAPAGVTLIDLPPTRLKSPETDPGATRANLEEGLNTPDQRTNDTAVPEADIASREAGTDRLQLRGPSSSARATLPADAAEKGSPSEKERLVFEFLGAVGTSWSAGRTIQEDLSWIRQSDVLFETYEKAGIDWLHVFGTSLTTIEVASAFKAGEYGKGWQKLSEYAALQLLSQNATANQLLGAKNIASLAALPIELGLRAFVDLVDSKGFENQVKAYSIARREVGLSHQQIVGNSNSSVSGSGIVWFGRNGFITEIISDGPSGALSVPRFAAGPITRIDDSGPMFEVIRSIYKADQTEAEAQRKLAAALEDFRNIVEERRGDEAVQDAATEPSAVFQRPANLDSKTPAVHPSLGIAPPNSDGFAPQLDTLPSPLPPGNTVGRTWEVQSDPDLALKAGEQALGFAVSEDGLASFQGQPLFSGYRAPEPDYQRVAIFFDEAERRAVALFMHDGAERIALVDLEAGRVLNDAPRPFWRYGPTDEVIWDPSGRYAALPMPMAEYSTGLGIFELSTGRYRTIPDRDFDANALDSWLADSLETRPDGTVAIKVAVEKLDAYGTPMPSDGSQPETRIIDIATFFDASASEDEGLSNDTADAGRWTADIVWDEWPMPGTCPQTRTRECLAEAGVSGPALDFAFTVEPNNWGDVQAIEFRELGRIDFARLSVNYPPYEHTVLLNGSPDILDPQLTTSEHTVFMDSTSQRILVANPGAYLFYPQFTAHRHLADGTQRFVLTETLMSGARATGSMIGAAVSFLDYPPGERAPSRRPVAISEISGSNWSEMTTASIRTNPSELQSALNSLGYDSGEVDGYPGPQTRAALMAFQAEQCLPATGQPDRATIAALRSVDRFAAPCPQARPYPGISVNAPLLSGIFVDDPAKCKLDNLPYDTVHLSQRIVRGETITWGQEGGCETTRTDINDGVTLFRGSCFEGDQAIEARWRFDVTSNESFVDLGFEGRRDALRTFSRCSDDSVLRQAWAAWFGSDAEKATAPGTAPAAPPGLTAVPASHAASSQSAAATLVISEATGAQLAAILRSHGVIAENSRVADSPSGEVEVAALLPAYRDSSPFLRTPALPLSTEGYDTTSGKLSICIRNRISLPSTRISPENPADFSAVILEREAAYVNIFQSNCIVGDQGRIAEHEAIFGKGDIELFGLGGGGALPLDLTMDSEAAQLFMNASNAGALRAIADCEMVYRERAPGQSTRYDYRLFGTCVLRRLVLTFDDYDQNTHYSMAFRATGEIFPADGSMVVETIAPVAVGSVTPEAVSRAATSFTTSASGENAIREILNGFVGQPAEVILGYANAFPFQMQREKELAVAVFGRLPQDEIDSVSGTERGYGSFVIKAWSDLNRYYFQDDPRTGYASAILGEIEELRVLSLQEVSGRDCEWATTYRIWLRNPTEFGAALATVSGKDGYTFFACFRTTRSGFDIVERAYVD